MWGDIVLKADEKILEYLTVYDTGLPLKEITIRVM